MKIAIAHELLTKLGGAERVVKNLTDMYPKAPIYTLFYNKKSTDDWFSNKKIHPSKLQKWYKLGIKPKFMLSKIPKAVEKLNFNKYNVVISSSSAFMHGIKVPKNCKHICYCHSPMRYAWDYTHEYTKNYGNLMRFLIANKLNKIRQWDYHTSNNPDILIANSKHVQNRINKYWRKKSQVIYPPIDVKKFTPRKEHEDYFLIVSALTPFKNIELAIKTFNKIRRKLVIIGDGTQRKYLESIANDNIEFLGYKDNHATRDYYEHCRAFIFPGEEDFGITPVEAMSAGKPVLAYGVGGVTESVRAGVSGEFFYHPTAQSLEDGLARLLANEKNYYPQTIRTIAEKFDKRIFEEKIKKLITKL